MLEKILDVEKQNKFLLREMRKNQEEFEKKVEEKLDQISKAVEGLKEEKVALSDVKGKGKGKSPDVFHHVYLIFIIHCLLFILNIINIIVEYLLI